MEINSPKTCSTLCLDSWAVLLARHVGTHVNAVCSSSKVEFVRARGAASVTDDTKVPLPTDGRFDVILDHAGH